MTEQLEIRTCRFESGENRTTSEGETLQLGEFKFSVASTGLQLMKGLAGIESIGEVDGMLFDFGCDWSPIMTPKGLLFPVDLAFITSKGHVMEIHALDPAMPYTQSTIRTDIRYALEVEKGFFERHGIKLGDSITISA